MALINIGVDSWQHDYESAERLHRSVLAEVSGKEMARNKYLIPNLGRLPNFNILLGRRKGSFTEV